MQDKDFQDLLAWIDDIGINNLIWCTDLDHTILDMVQNAAQVKATPELEQCLNNIDKQTEGRFFIITGREMSYVENLFPSRLLKASTEYHNVMRWEVDEQAEELRDKPQWHLIDSKIDNLIQSYWPEHYQPRQKPFMRSLHFHTAHAFKDENYKNTVKTAIKEILDEYHTVTGQPLENIDGGEVFDIAPLGSNKGQAMRDILNFVSPIFPDRKLLPVYFGDSPGDLPVAPVIKVLGGKFISVGHNAQVQAQADFQLETPSICRELFLKASELPNKMPLYNSTFTDYPAAPELP